MIKQINLVLYKVWLMDQRTTFEDLNQLLAIVSDLHQHKEKASFIVDNDGLARIDGIITAIVPNDTIKKTSIHIHPTTRVQLENIIAVNGIFRSDYSEC